MADSPWSGIQNIGAIDQKLYQPAKKEESPPVSSPAKRTPTEPTDIPVTPVVKPQKQQQVKKQVQVERKERQLNAWITATQNDTLDQLYFRLRAQGMRLKKGELVGIGIEILATILEQISPKAIDRTLLNIYLSYYEKQKQKDT
jgi:hypothetical protein